VSPYAKLDDMHQQYASPATLAGKSNSVGQYAALTTDHQQYAQLPTAGAAIYARVPTAGPSAAAKASGSDTYAALANDREIYQATGGMGSTYRVPGLDPAAPCVAPLPFVNTNVGCKHRNLLRSLSGFQCEFNATADKGYACGSTLALRLSYFDPAYTVARNVHSYPRAHKHTRPHVLLFRITLIDSLYSLPLTLTHLSNTHDPRY
jgi:hypothetical protein